MMIGQVTLKYVFFFSKSIYYGRVQCYVKRDVLNFTVFTKQLLALQGDQSCMESKF
jgi:hypothetical protein